RVRGSVPGWPENVQYRRWLYLWTALHIRFRRYAGRGDRVPPWTAPAQVDLTEPNPAARRPFRHLDLPVASVRRLVAVAVEQVQLLPRSFVSAARAAPSRTRPDVPVSFDPFFRLTSVKSPPCLFPLTEYCRQPETTCCRPLLLGEKQLLTAGYTARK